MIPTAATAATVSTAPRRVPRSPQSRHRALCGALCFLAALPVGAAPTCQASSGATITPVLELYTSEGCSSCPPAEQWLSTLRDKAAVVQAFHVTYWDSLGWPDRFASPLYTARQRDLAALNHADTVYTPQLVRNGQDWRDYARATLSDEAARVRITLSRTEASEHYQARVQPLQDSLTWNAYWSVTENGYSAHVSAGENAGSVLQHDFVVRQYVPVGRYSGAQTLDFVALAAVPGHERQINLVVSEGAGAKTLQALSLRCKS